MISLIRRYALAALNAGKRGSTVAASFLTHNAW